MCITEVHPFDGRCAIMLWHNVIETPHWIAIWECPPKHTHWDQLYFMLFLQLAAPWDSKCLNGLMKTFNGLQWLQKRSLQRGELRHTSLSWRKPELFVHGRGVSCIPLLVVMRTYIYSDWSTYARRDRWAENWGVWASRLNLAQTLRISNWGLWDLNLRKCVS